MKQGTKDGLMALLWMVIVGVVIFLGIAVADYYFYFNEENIIITKNISQIQFRDSGYLEKLLEKEIVDIPNWTCVDYVVYYNTTLKKYNEGLTPPERILDIRELRYMDVCNGLTLCNSYHTFLVIGGYGQECILDQQEIKCVSLMEYKEIKSNEEKKE